MIPYLFHDGEAYHIETSPLIFSANQWTGFYMIETSVRKELKTSENPCLTLSTSMLNFYDPLTTSKNP